MKKWITISLLFFFIAVVFLGIGLFSSVDTTALEKAESAHRAALGEFGEFLGETYRIQEEIDDVEGDLIRAKAAYNTELIDSLEKKKGFLKEELNWAKMQENAAASVATEYGEKVDRLEERVEREKEQQQKHVITGIVLLCVGCSVLITGKVLEKKKTKSAQIPKASY